MENNISLNTIPDWLGIRKQVNYNFQTNFHVAVATVDENNNPTVSPIGSLFLNADQTGFFLEKFTTSVAKNYRSNKNVCILSVNSGKWFWFKSIFKGRFKPSPGIKLYGTLQPKREATAVELNRMNQRFQIVKGFKGYKLLWEDMRMVRPIVFTKAEFIKIGKMTAP